jgi:hypothetical protein
MARIGRSPWRPVKSGRPDVRLPRKHGDFAFQGQLFIPISYRFARPDPCITVPARVAPGPVLNPPA